MTRDTFKDLSQDYVYLLTKRSQFIKTFLRENVRKPKQNHLGVVNKKFIEKVTVIDQRLESYKRIEEQLLTIEEAVKSLKNR